MKAKVLCPLILTCSLATLRLAPAAENPPAANESAAGWPELKDCTFDRRDLFLAGSRDWKRVDAQVAELAAKRAAMEASNTSSKEWDFVMQEMGSARTKASTTSEHTRLISTAKRAPEAPFFLCPHLQPKTGAG